MSALPSHVAQPRDVAAQDRVLDRDQGAGLHAVGFLLRAKPGLELGDVQVELDAITW
jgi:hypothetical protein